MSPGTEQASALLSYADAEVGKWRVSTVRVRRQGQEGTTLGGEMKMWFCTEGVYPMRQDISEKNRECLLQIPPQVEKT